MSNKTLLRQAYHVGVLVTEVEHHLFVTAPVLSAPCVRMTEDGLHDVINRMRLFVDNRATYDKARDSAMHGRLVNLMLASKRLANEQAMLMYDPRNRVVRDLRIPHRYREALVHAQQRLP